MAQYLQLVRFFSTHIGMREEATGKMSGWLTIHSIAHVL